MKFRPSTSFRRLCRRLHYWFGVGIAVPFFLIAISGCIIGFGREVDMLLSPEFYRATGPDLTVSAQQVLDTARADSSVPVMTLQVPGPDLPVWIVSLGNGKGTGIGIQREVFIDPQSGSILGERETYPTLIRFMHRLHDALLMDETGRQLVGYLGLMLAGLIVTGLFVWLPPPQGWRRSFLPRRGAKGTRWLLDWHTAAFAWPLLLIVLVTVTGITLEFPQTTRAALGQSGGMGMMGMGMAGPVLPPANAYPIDADKAMVQARLALPGYEVINMSPAGLDRPMWRVNMRSEQGLWQGRRQVMVDARNGVAHSHAPAEGFGAFYVAEQHGLHGGNSFGLVGRTVICFGGLSQAFLAVSGLLVWVRRRRRGGVKAVPQTIASQEV